MRFHSKLSLVYYVCILLWLIFSLKQSCYLRVTVLRNFYKIISYQLLSLVVTLAVVHRLHSMNYCCCFGDSMTAMYCHVNRSCCFVLIVYCCFEPYTSHSSWAVNLSGGFHVLDAVCRYRFVPGTKQKKNKQNYIGQMDC